MANEFWPSDAQWAVIEPLLPKNQPGARRADDRRVISKIVHVLKIGCRWQDCPGEAENGLYLFALTMPSPRLIEAIANGNAAADLTVTSLARNLRVSWAEQERIRVLA